MRSWAGFNQKHVRVLSHCWVACCVCAHLREPRRTCVPFITVSILSGVYRDVRLQPLDLDRICTPSCIEWIY